MSTATAMIFALTAASIAGVIGWVAHKEWAGQQQAEREEDLGPKKAVSLLKTQVTSMPGIQFYGATWDRRDAVGYIYLTKEAGMAKVDHSVEDKGAMVTLDYRDSVLVGIEVLLGQSSYEGLQ